MARMAFTLASVALMTALPCAFGALFLGGGEIEETCTDLYNKGAYFAVKVSIGTPLKDTDPQQFEVVADTGSDSVIVTSCACVQNEFCEKTDKCFTGTNRSSSFAVMKELVNKTSNQTAPVGVAMTFGSGTVMNVIATDMVEVAGRKANMSDGLLLMVDRRALNIQGEFQGILGLGPPDKNRSVQPKGNFEVMKSSGDAAESGHPDDNTTSHTNEKNGTVSHANESNHSTEPDSHRAFKPMPFLQRAGVERYSLCFNDGGTPGQMRLNVPKFKQPLPTVGNFHWGLGLHGISVGDETADAVVCGPNETFDSHYAAIKDGKIKEVVKSGQKGKKTPCGAIPDSGTTLLMGPAKQIEKLFSAACDSWDRCKKAHENGDHGVLKNMSKSHAFQKLLENCHDWKSDDKGLDEVPSLFFNVGEKDNQQKLELTAWSYIVETSQEIFKYHKRYLFGIIPVSVPEPTGKMKNVCIPNLGVTEFNTQDNGPVWIMGHPLFYQYTIGYSLGKHSTAPGAKGEMAMAFEKGKCGSCKDTKTSFLSSQSHLRPTWSRPLRVSHDPPRVRQYETNLPM